MASKKTQKNTPTKKLIFSFEDAGQAGATIEGLGGKGFNLVRSHALGIPVPPANILSTELCQAYKQNPQAVLDYLKNEAIPTIVSALKAEGRTSLFSVRSGARVSMPGMMDTILNVGVTKNTMTELEGQIGARAARDCRRRFMQMYGEVVFGIAAEKFENEISAIKTKRRVKEDSDLTETDLSDLIASYDKLFKREKQVLPETLEGQILGAAEAVLKSWDNPRAQEYRRIRGYPDDWGTAIVIQKMVFGNLDDKSATGVLFTRNPASGRHEVMGEFLVKAQGEDVVAGIRTPDPLYLMKDWNPEAYKTLMNLAETLETESRDLQDIEFTIESGTVYILQTRNAQRSALAAMQVAVDMSKSGLISKKEALDRVSLAQYEQLCQPMIAPTYNAKPDTIGLSASTGIASGKAVFSNEAALENPGACILIAQETTPEDLPGMHAAKGILTATGGVTSHAAVVARGMDKVCVVGAEEIKFTKNSHGEISSVKIGQHTVNEGDTVTIDGASGRVWVGTSVPVIPGGDLPVMLDFNDMIYEVYPVYRIVTDGRDLNSEIRSVYATYMLDGLPELQIKSEIKDSMPYLNGILDLSTMEEHADEEDAEILALGGSNKDDESFAIKAEAALSYGGERQNIKIHLGRHHDEYKGRFERAGFQVLRPSSSINDINKDESVFAICKSSKGAEAIIAAQLGGQTAGIAAVPTLDRELLLSMRDQPQGSPPAIAMSVPQILSSLKPK